MSYLKPYQILLFFILLFISFYIFTPILSAKYATIDDWLMLSSEKGRAIKVFSVKNVLNTFKSSHEGLYHPIITISYSLEKTIFGLVPEILHFDNIIFHLINSFLTFLIFLKLSNSFWLSFIITALFAVHPTRVEVVAWISARKDLLYTLFYLLSILFYVNTYNSKKIKTCIFLSLLCFALACFSKAMAITLPVILFLIDLYKNNFDKKKIKIYLIYLLIALIFIIVALIVHYSRDYKNIFFTSFNFVVYFINAHFNILFYLDKLLLPIKLYCMYPFFYDTLSMPPAFILYSPTVLYLLIFFSFLSLKKTKVVFYGFLFFLISILPASNIFPIGNFAVADRYTYIPYIGLFFIFAKLILYICNKTNKKINLLVIILCIIIFGWLCYLSYNRTIDWKNDSYGAPISMKYYEFGIKKNY